MLGFGGSWPPLCYESSQWHFHRNFFPNDMTRNRFYGPVRWLPNGFIAKTWFWFFCDFLSVSMLNILIYTDEFWFVSVWSEISLNIPAFLSGWTSIHVRLFAHWKPEKQTLPEILGAVGVVHAVAMGYELIIGVSFQWVITSWELLMGFPSAPCDGRRFSQFYIWDHWSMDWFMDPTWNDQF